MTNPEGKEIEQQLEQLENELMLLKQRYSQIERDQQKKAEWQQKAKDIQQAKNRTEEMRFDLRRIEKEIELIEINLESKLISWRSLNKPFWQVIRFGGLGILIGWWLKSWM
jgi:transcriptional regulator with XRE-family HTH domain